MENRRFCLCFCVCVRCESCFSLVNGEVAGKLQVLTEHHKHSRNLSKLEILRRRERERRRFISMYIN